MNDISRHFEGRHPGVAHFKNHFDYLHLDQRLQKYSGPYANLVVGLLKALPDGPELSVALRKLAESKDCAVRAGLAHEGMV